MGDQKEPPNRFSTVDRLRLIRRAIREGWQTDPEKAAAEVAWCAGVELGGTAGRRGGSHGRVLRSPAQPPQLVDDLVKSLALDELHGVEGDIPLVPDLEDRHDVRMVQPCSGLRLAAEPLQGLLASAAAWDTTGERLAVGTQEGEVTIWPFPSGEPLQRVPFAGRVSRVLFSPDGRYCGLAAGKRVRVWDCRQAAFATHELEHPAPVTTLAFDPRGELLGRA
jgi:hypothetical protein